MARQSFRLRRPTTGGDATKVGSFVRGTAEIQLLAGAEVLDSDSSIRSTGIITQIPTADISMFEGVATEYNGVLLNWQLEEGFKELVEIGNGESGLLSVLIVYSETGFPQTVLDGQVILDSATNSYFHQEVIQYPSSGGTITVTKPESGKWAYYSLFAYFNNDGLNGDYFYELLSSIEVLVPHNYGSLDTLWNRVPVYYREQDLKYDNHLYKFLDVFSFELDRTRTLIEAVTTNYDPLLAEADAIKELSSMLGLELGVEDIGVSRTRSLLHDIGYLRKNKGTEDATKAYLTAVSGSEVTVFTGASAPFYTYAVHAERANLVADPRFVGTQGTTWDVYSQNSVTVSTSPVEGIQITAGASATKVAVVCKVAIPMDVNHTYYTSVQWDGTPTVVYGGVWSAGASWSDWSTVYPTADLVPTGNASRSAYTMLTAASGTKYPVLLFSLAANQSIKLYRWMVEPNKAGDFFDGDTVFGGFLYQNFTSDYKWSGTRFSSYSIYSANRKRTQDSITRLLPKILPVTLMGLDSGNAKYAVQFDWIPGKSL
jgi:hypothetical protein